MNLEPGLRRFEKRLGIDRGGRTVWVWAMPPLIGVISGVLAALMPGLPSEFGWAFRLMLGLFAFVAMTVITFIYLISFDNDKNQQADDLPQK
jgi:hypothetical protein